MQVAEASKFDTVSNLAGLSIDASALYLLSHERLLVQVAEVFKSALHADFTASLLLHQKCGRANIPSRLAPWR